MFRSRWYVVSLLGTLYVMSYLDRLILTLMVEPIKSSFHLTDTQIGLLMGPAFAFFFSAVALPLAWLVDRGNRKRYLVAGVAFWSICTILSGFATSFEMLFALRMGLALGEAILSPVAISLIGDLFAKDERSTPTALYVSSATVGILLSYLAGGAIIGLVGDGKLASAMGLATLAPWRLSLVLIGLPSLFLAVLVLFTIREPRRSHAAPISQAEAQSDAERFGIFASLREAMQFFVPILIGNALSSLILYAILSWYPTHLIRTFGVNATQAGYIFSTAILLGVPPLLASSLFAQRIARTGRRDFLLFIPLVQIPLGVLFFIMALSQTSLLAASIFIALGYSLIACVSGLAIVSIPMTAPPAFRGRLTALFALANNLVGAGFGVFLIGFLSDTFFKGPDSIRISLLVTTCIAGPIMWLFYFLAWKPYRTASYRTMPMSCDAVGEG